MMMRMVWAMGLVVISVLLPIVKLLELVTCSHLVSILLEVLKLVEGSEIEGPRGDGEYGLGIQLRLGGLPSWVLLDRLHINVLLVVSCKLVGVLILRMRAHVLMASSDLAYSVVLAAFTAGFFSSVSPAT